MEDNDIVELYWQRDEKAVSETAAKYGNYLHSISYNILCNAEDAEECVNSAYNDAWNTIPPHRPSVLSTFLGKLIRRSSIDMWRSRGAEKRGGGTVAVAIDELEECVSGNDSVEDETERRELQEKLNVFLKELPKAERQVFMRRYWYMDSNKDIAERFSCSETRIRSMLYRTRKKLRKMLEKEGY